MSDAAALKDGLEALRPTIRNALWEYNSCSYTDAELGSLWGQLDDCLDTALDHNRTISAAALCYMGLYLADSWPDFAGLQAWIAGKLPARFSPWGDAVTLEVPGPAIHSLDVVRYLGTLQRFTSQNHRDLERMIKCVRTALQDTGEPSA